MNYDYKVRDPLGKTLEGVVDASSRDAAVQMLRRDGFHVLDLNEQSAGISLFEKPITKAEIIYTTSQLAIMVDTGITLATALEGIAEQEENPTLKKVLNDLRNGVEAGEDFSTALMRYPKLFDRTFVSLVKASERTGSLGSMLDRIASYLSAEMAMRSKVRGAMAYPAVMMVIAFAVTVFLLTYVMPKFTPMFESRGDSLPKSTKVMMVVSDALMDYWYAWLIGLAVVVVGYVFGRRTEEGKKILDWMKINIPILGPTFRKVIISRSVRTLGTMLQSGVSMLDAVRLSADVSGNYYYEKTWHHVLEQITQGARICEALQDSPYFPRTLVQMIGSGEETGKLDYVLEKVSTYYDREVETSLKTATSMIEPLLITVMGVVVGGIAMSLMLPIFSLSRPSG